MTNLIALEAPPITERAFDVSAAKAQFLEDGYVLLRGVVNRELLANLTTKVHEEYARAREDSRLFSGGGFLSGHVNCYTGVEAKPVYQALEDAGVIELVRSLLPSSTRLPNVGCNYNLPGSGKQHYHADRPFTQEFMIVNIAMVDTDLVNGAIDLLPGTHKKFYPFWRFVMDRVHRRTTRMPVSQGDVLVRSSNLWHRGMPNNSNTPRPMLAFTWEDGGSFLEDPFAMDGGGIAFRPNWFRPTRLGRLRERVFVKAPLTYSAYRFVDSILTSKGY